MDNERKISLLRKMILMRHFDTRVSGLFKSGHIKGSVHTYIGQEAIASGICENLIKEDFIFTTHRCHGHTLAKGGEPRKVLSEILGKVDGYCKGRGGSMHMISKKNRSMALAIVGANIPIGTGAAFGFKKDKSKNIAVVFFGEGATNQGTFHESLNLASIFKLPVLFVCENNKYAVSSDVEKMTNVKNISIRSKAYGIEGQTIDGNDVTLVYKTSKKIINKIRNGKGPFLLEAVTYRWEGHYTGEPCVYRKKEETEKWIKKCPIKKYKDILLKEKVISKKDFDDYTKEIEDQIEDAFNFSMKSSEFAAEKYKDYVYKE